MDWIWILILVGALTVLFLIKEARVFLRKVDTFYHEMSHGFFVVLLRGKIENIHINKDESGSIEYFHRSFLARTIILLAGYTGSSIIAVGTFYLMMQQKYEWLFWFYMSSLIIGVLAFLRNRHGFIWGSTLVLMLGLIQYYLGIKYTSILVILLVLMQNVGSITGGYDIFLRSIKQKESAGDAWSLRKMWKLPTVFFGFLFFLESVVVVVANSYVFYKVYF